MDIVCTANWQTAFDKGIETRVSSVKNGRIRMNENPNWNALKIRNFIQMMFSISWHFRYQQLVD